MRSWLPSSRRKGALEALLGLTFRGFAFVHLGFAALALVLGEEAWGFLGAAALGFALGYLGTFRGRPKAQPQRAEVFAGVALLWLLVPVLGAVPYWISGGLAFLDALFESMSGYTATGATVRGAFPRGLPPAPRGGAPGLLRREHRGGEGAPHPEDPPDGPGGPPPLPGPHRGRRLGVGPRRGAPL